MFHREDRHAVLLGEVKKLHGIIDEMWGEQAFQGAENAHRKI